MATEDKLNDYDFTGTDAGASHTIPSEAGQIRKGGYIVIKGHPCKVSEHGRRVMGWRPGFGLRCCQKVCLCLVLWLMPYRAKSPPFLLWRRGTGAVLEQALLCGP